MSAAHPAQDGATLVEVLLRRAAEHPDRRAYRFLVDGEEEGAALTYGELDLRARALAAELAARGLAGERALLLFPPGLDFVVAFLGCLYAGVIAVPAYPPRPNRPDGRLRAIAADARPRLALTTRALKARVAALTAHNPILAGLDWLASEDCDPTPPVAAARFRPGAEALAFLQYTSGSTATPKGVAVHHRHLVHNQGLIERAFGQSEASVIVGWLPLYHDMGLIGNVLQPLWLGATCVLMAPVAFLQRPLRWLEAIDRYRATTSGGPNFAYDLCVQKIGAEERQGLDLSSWTVAFNGAEPVRAETLDRFAAAFAPCGFKRSAFLPCYGLAEATLFVAGAAPGGEPAVLAVDAAALERDRALPVGTEAGRRLVGCGAPGPDQRVLVVDAESRRPLPAGAVGEVWVAGPSVTAGYWNRPEESAQVFGARLADEAGGDSGGWLRTGDLGFVAGGDLYLTGRLKDLIVLRGRNLYPQDLEATVERCHPGFRAAGCMAFAVEEGSEERLVLVAELERAAERELGRDPGAAAALLAAIRRAVAEEHDAAPWAIALVRAGTVPRTSSGKLRRGTGRADFLAGRLAPLALWRQDEAAAAGEPAALRPPAGPLETRLERLVAGALGVDAVGVDQDLFALGVDSLQAARLLALVNEAFAVEIALDELFAAPTVAELAAAIGAAVARARGPRLAPRPAGDGPWPLSFAQRRLWFLHQLEPHNPVHNLAAALGLTGPLDVPALFAAFGEIVRRHEALRTVFTPAGGEPGQRIGQPFTLPVRMIDLSRLSWPARREAAGEAARSLGRVPFDLESGRLLRAALLRWRAPGEDAPPPYPGMNARATAATPAEAGFSRRLSGSPAIYRRERGDGEDEHHEHELILALHHIAADGGALAVLAGELGALYGAFAAGRPSPLPELPLQYADYALWQRRRLSEEAMADDLAYWRARLAGTLAPLELPADRSRPAVLSHRGAHLEIPLGRELSAALAGAAREWRATPFLLFVAGFAALLHRYTGQDDLLVGTPVAGRDRGELEGLLGIFLNNLVLRLDLAGEPGFAALLGRVREAVVGAFAHAAVPFERLVDELQPGRDLSRTPLFQVLIVGQNAPLAPFELPVPGGRLQLAPREVDLGSARFDLALSLAPSAQGWTGTWKLSTDLFDPPTVARMALHLENLLAAALAAPERPLAGLALLSAAERHQVLAGWNDTATVYPEAQGACLHELIAAQAARSPEATAVEEGALRLSYSELLERAGALAGRLRALGVGAESRVGIAAYRSLDMVVGLLGTMVAGAAYVPLDPDYPAERLAYMVEDAAPDALLVQDGLLARLGPLPARLAAGGRVLGIAAAAAPGPLPGEDPAFPPGPETPAYVIYTSGSTGRPKGVAVPHRGIVNRLLWMQAAYGLGPGDRVLQKTPYSFDVSVWEFFWPLLTGARLVVAPPGAHQDPAHLAALIERHGITTLHFVPSLLQVFLDQPGLEAHCRGLRRVFTSGEALPKELAERFLARLPGVELHNLYGPTEASVDVTYHPCRPGGRRQILPIGRPIANTSILVLDRRLDPLPIGVPGELLIGGVGLARGYLGRPGLTAERFVPDPYAGAPGARLYRTGDLVRFRPDGEVEFLGRLDHQVKIRGVRIELGEIEAALVQHPAVREAVVMAEGGRLVAYLVPPVGGAVPGAGELRAFLRLELPEVMVPATFAVLAAFPLTASGKVDRRALAAAGIEDEGEAPAADAFEEPRAGLERRLAELWRETLGVARIGRHDNFFELGGDSIQGAMLANRLQRELGEIVYVMALFDAPTVAGLAASLAGRYAEAVARWVGEPAAGAAPLSNGEPAPAVEAGLAELRAAVARRLGRRPAAAEEMGERNPPAVFLLSPFRSGSTLLRVMLAGHPRLFAPPELELLAFTTLAERRRAYSGRDSFAREGLLRAVMELRGLEADGAESLVAAAEGGELPVGRFYRQLQDWAGGRLLVDKTPSYALDTVTLERAERLFDQPLYVHLVRAPGATIVSYVEAHMDQVYPEYPGAPAVQAEWVWLLAHDNILRFLGDVPAERQHRLRFEDLLRDPRRQMEALGRFLGVGFDPGMLEPYAGGRMTDGPRAGSRMMGDPKFHRHAGIDAGVAERARPAAAALAEPTRQLAAFFGYEAPPAARATAPATSGLRLAPVPRDGSAPLTLSFSQERLWFLAQLDAASPAYNMPAAVRLSGALDVAALGRAFAEVRRRHEVLRTTFPAALGGPVPRIAPFDAAELDEPLPVIDLAALPAAARAAEEARLALAEGRRPFDLAAGPLLRAALLDLSRAQGREGERGFDGQHRPPRPGINARATEGAPAEAGFSRRLLGSPAIHRRVREAACPPFVTGREGERVLLVTLHHIVSDGWTVGVLMRELGTLYAAFAARRPSPLPELPLQYADYAWHQRRWLAGEAMAAHLTYWRRRLAGTLPPLELPTDRPRPPIATAVGARLSRTLDAATTEAIRAAAPAAGGTFFLILLAAFDALLHRYTGQDDLLLGIPVANRNRFETEGLIGVFLNMVVERADAGGDPPFADLLARVREGFLSSIPHQEVPFEKLVEDLQPQRDLSRAPIFQVQFSLQNTPAEPLALPGIEAEFLERHNRSTKFDLTVFLFDRPGGLTTTLEYNTDLFDRATMARFLAHWHGLLGAAVTGAALRLSALPLLAPAERAELLAFGNEPRATLPVDEPLHRIFARQAARHPSAVAVVADLEEITYGGLETRANRLAHRLRALGVGPEVRVGLSVERSLDLVVGILGILKAGGAYVPLDPAYPPERLAFLLGDAFRGQGTERPIVVTQPSLVERFAADPAGPRLDLVVLGPEAAELATGDAEPPAELPGNGADNAAYVIYTSGSTGRPKGVVIPHAQVVRLFTATEPWFGFSADDVWTLFHSFAFDFSVWEIWGALLYGGRLVVVPRQVALSPPDFYDLLAGERVTMLSQTPSAFRQLVALEGEEGVRRLHLRAVVFGGEALDLPVLAPWIARHGDAKPALVNMYGITETTVHVTYRPIRAADLEHGAASPIGPPIPDLTCHLLGRQLELLPVGVPGEIHVGGAGLARGYLGRPELTAERFVPDPFAEAPGARLYKSGDLARRLHDGDLEYLGRRDNQVKIRGFRIELGEIEAALLGHPAVESAVVLARPGAGGERRLVAWVIARPDAGVAELRAHLERSLPAYMVPAAIVPLERFPLTANGKVDRRALPDPEDVAGPAGAGAKAPPRTQTEARLARIWGELLARRAPGATGGAGQGFGRDDDFFEQGGHSLLAAQLAARIRSALGVELPLRAIFEAPRLAAMAARLDVELDASAPLLPDLVAREPRRGERLPLSWPQRRLWFLDQLEGEAATLNISTVLRLTGPLDVAAFHRALLGVAHRHEALRTRFELLSGEPWQVVEEEEALASPVIDLAALPADRREAEARRQARREIRRPFDLKRLPLFRAVLLRLAADEHLLVLAVHHIVADGWSMGVLTREVSALYRLDGAADGRLPALPVQYGDYTLWQRQWLAGELVEGHLGFWRERLAGVPRLELPLDHPRPAVSSPRAGFAELELPGPLAEGVGALARSLGATPFMALLGALQLLLGRHGAASDVTVGTPVANRDRAEVQGLIGLFLNTLALRSDLADDPPFADFLARVKAATLDAFAHQELPFERVLEEVNPERSLNRTPLFDVLLNFLQFAEERIDLAGLAVDTLPGLDHAAKFDLTLYALPLAHGLRLSAVYRAELFEPATVERLLAQLGNLLAAAVARPEATLTTLPLLSEAEYLELERAANRIAPQGPAAPFPAPFLAGSLADRFAEQARLTPDAVAVSSRRQSVSYGELDRRSNGVARAILARCGAGEGRVALLFAPDVPMLAAVFGALKAGKTYVPLDRSYPRERLAFMLEDSASALLVTHTASLPLAEQLAHGLVPRVAILDAERTEPDEAPPDLSVSPDAPAYILYTSGSTGRPKGVVQSHGNVLHHARAHAGVLHVTAADRVSLLPSLSHDAAVVDVFGALLHGAVLCPFDVRGEGVARIPGWLAEQGITVYHSTPTVFRHVCLARESAPAASTASVRLVVLGGETATRHDLELFRQAFPPGCLLANGLGPSESTVALQFLADHETVVRRPTVPVGYPVEGTRIELANERGEPVDVLAIGEVVIRGRHVALGYWQRPEQTAAAFSGELGQERAYRTGDLGRRLLDGSYEFIGRRDFQVKIRGHRVEMEEIEATLARGPGVGEVAVVARQDPAGELCLAAFTVPRPGERLTVEALRAFARESLPEPMVPAAFVLLDELPQTPTRKVDRAALPTPDFARLDGDADGGTAPRTPVEEMLAAIWGEVLQRDRIGIEHSFFDLGGHSLLATRVLSRVRGALGVDLALRQLFEAPTVAGLARVVEGLRRGGGPVAAPPLVKRAEDDGPAPLSFAQQRVWFLDRLEPGGHAYNLLGGFRLIGRLDVPALAAALGEVVRRHQVLRTHFELVDERPVQVVGPGFGGLPEVDLSRLAGRRRTAEAARLARLVGRRPFDLERGPLLRLLLLRERRAAHRLAFAMHHAVSDGWSMGLFFRETVALYTALTRGEARTAAALAGVLPDLSLQYADYAVWQRQWLAGDTLARELAYWRGHLAGAPEVIELPTDRPRPARPTYRAGVRRWAPAAERVAGLRALARDLAATPFMVWLAAFGGLLARLCRQDDVVLGTPIANRGRVEIEPLIGFFANTLALRVAVGGEPSFADLVARVREAALGGYAHQDVPFEMVVEALEPQRDLSRSPLFQVMFVLQNLPDARVELPDLRLVPLPETRESAKFDLTLALEERESGIGGVLEYALDLFDAPTAERLLGAFDVLLAGALAAPERAVAALPLLGEAERHQLRVEWNDRQADYPREVSFAALFAAQAARTPDAAAVSCGAATLSYGELERRAGGAARRLAALGGGPGTVVALLGERGPGFLIAVLAVWKSGAAYLPLDPRHPPDHQRRILGESGAAVMLAAPAFARAGADLLAGLPAAPELLDWDDAAAPLPVPAGPGAAGGPVGAAGDLAYVLFTSGSTGVPKGAMVEHGGMVNHLWAKLADLGLSAADTVAQTASQSFDISVWQFFAPLAVGGEVRVYPDEVAHDPARLLAALDEDGATIFETVPSLLRTLLAEAERLGEGRPRLAGLRWLLATGEALPPDLCRDWAAVYGGVPLLNAYGPTECSDDVTHHLLREPPDAEAVHVPIGRPVANTRLHLLDGALEWVPIGVVGEIWIAGDGVGRGYLGDAAKTAAAFRPDLAAERPGARMYRSGDLGRRLAGGEIVFLGRIDQQVKVRGFRIELGEVEAALAAHPGVAEAVVLAEPEPAGGRLVAFVVARAGAALDLAELRQHVKRLLPDYMVPGLLAALEEMPRTANGKIDRRALAAAAADETGAVGPTAPGAVLEGLRHFVRQHRPAPVALDPAPPAGGAGGRKVLVARKLAAASAAYAPPRDELEAVVTDLFAAVVGAARVGIHDNFFDLGGHSLLATQVVSRVRSVLGVEVPLRALFEAPTAAGLAAVVAARRTEGRAQAPPLVRRSGTAAAPLSFAQQRLWFLDRLEPGSFAYNVTWAFRLEGRLDRAALAAALSELVRRHEALRTHFAAAENGDGPVQIVAPPRPVVPAEVDLTRLGEPAARREAERLAASAARRPFDLAHGPLLRATLAREGEAAHLLSFVLHHAISDGWSVGVLIRELATLYDAGASGRAATPAALGEVLPELPIQYADYAVWQRGWVAGAVLEEQLAYWRAHLAGAAETALDLPTDRPRPPRQTFRGAVERLRLPGELTAAVAALGHRLAATPFMVLLAAFDALLARYSGQERIVVGTPIANRNRVEIEPLIGFFANTLALRVELAGEPSFTAAVERAREAALGGYSHQDVPFELVVEALAPERDLARPPLFQVMFVLQNAPAAPLALPGLELAPVEVAIGRAAFDLILNLAPAPQDGGTAGINAWLELNLDLFDRATGRRMLGHFERLLAAAVAEPGAPLAELPLLGSEERAELISQPELPQGEIELLHRRFARQAALCPDAVAVVFDGQALSYGDLANRAAALAGRLAALGVGPEVRVGLLAEPSPAMVVGILGVLAAGGTYVPLDPKYPAERLRFLLADAGLAALVAEERLLAGLPGLPEDARVVLLDGREDGEAATPRADLSPDLSPDQGAYVIYTSGSTGTPKGVVVSHRNVARLFTATERWFGFGPDDAWSLFHSYAFDFSVWELWGALLYGGRLVIAPYWVSREPAAFYRLLAGERVTMLSQTPSAFNQLIRAEEELGVAPDLALRAVVLGGEALTVASLAPWWDRHGEAAPRIVNMYGITETTVHVTYRPLGVRDLEPAAGSPVGVAIPDLSLAVLDRHLALQPLGVPGELGVGGFGVARGYWRRPELTAQRFVPDPYSATPGARLYRSGDLGRWTGAGAVEYLGRIDRQVKIRGFRIELAEIESCLASSPRVQEAVVLAVGSGAASRLVAYVVPAVPGATGAAGGDAGERRALADWLRARLPDYMVPAGWVFLDRLPLTAHGKVNRAALPEPAAALEQAPVAWQAPRGPVEELLAGIWREVLGLEQVPGRDDGFFDLGGQSLLATRVMSRIRADLGVEVALRQLFAAPTVAGLGAAVQAARQGAAGSQAPPLVPASRQGPLPLAWAQERLWFLEQLEEGVGLYGLPFSLRLEGAVRPEVLAASLAEIVRRHEILRTRFVAVDGRPLQVIDAPWRPPLTGIDLSGLPAGPAAAERKRLLEMDWPPFDLAAGPLLRAALVREGDGRFVLLVVMHHIITDGWSMGVLLAELAAIYPALAAGRAPALPELAVQFADFAAWQRGWLAGDVLAGQLAYWKERLAGLSRLALPFDRPAAEGHLFLAGAQPLVVPEPLTARLNAFAGRAGASPFMVLLAAFKALLHRHAGQDDVAVGSPIANRNRAEIEPLIGFFVNTLVLRTDLAGGPSFHDLLGRVREATLGAYDHQDLPFALLVEALQPDRRKGAVPLADALFSLQNQPLPEIALPGVELSPLRPEHADFITQFALVLVLAEREGSLQGTWSYNAGLLDAPTAGRWRDHWLRLLAVAIEDPACPIGDIPLLSASERHQVLVDGRFAGGDEAEVVFVGDQPAPIGVWGELCRRDALGTRTPTGRRARRRADGSLELAGSTVPAGDPAAAPPVADEAERRIAGLDEARTERSKRRETLSDTKRELLVRRLSGRLPGAPGGGSERRPPEPAPTGPRDGESG